MKNDIYLSRKSDLEEGFFLRVIKGPEQLEYRIDQKKPPKFSPGKEGESDLLEVWIKEVKAPYSNVLVSDKSVIENAKRVTKKVKIKLMISQANETVDQTKFAYKKAFLESHIDDWSKRFKPD